MQLAMKPGAYLAYGIDFFGVVITFYAMCIVLGAVIAVALGMREAKKTGIHPDVIFNGVCIIAPLSILGTRLYYVIFDSFSRPDYYQWNIMKILDFRSGGLAIHGGIIVAFISTIIYTRVVKTNIWKIIDYVAPGFLLAQACGRWGNFFNQEVYGKVVEGDNPLGWMPTFMREQMYINGAYREPLFLYESVLNLLMFVVFMIVRRKRLLRIGDMACIYFIWYGIIRAILEPLRDSQFILSSSGSNMQSVITSILLVVAGVALLVYKYVWLKLPFYYDCLVENEESGETIEQNQ